MKTHIPVVSGTAIRGDEEHFQLGCTGHSRSRFPSRNFKRRRERAPLLG